MGIGRKAKWATRSLSNRTKYDYLKANHFPPIFCEGVVRCRVESAHSIRNHHHQKELYQRNLSIELNIACIKEPHVILCIQTFFACFGKLTSVYVCRFWNIRFSYKALKVLLDHSLDSITNVDDSDTEVLYLNYIKELFKKTVGILGIKLKLNISITTFWRFTLLRDEF